MSTQTPLQVPLRNASLAAFAEQRIKNRNSRNELNRQLSDSSLSKDSGRYIKLRIMELELEQEDLMLEKDEFLLKKEEKCIDLKTYRAARRAINKRIISLGDNLWKYKRELRSHDEGMGKITKLTPDYEGAFGATLLRLYKDPLVSRKRDSTKQSNMRRDAIKAYSARREDGTGKVLLRCTISNDYFPSDFVAAAHIVPASLGGEVADYIFGIGTGARIFSADNCIMMNKAIEGAFDSGNFVLLPLDTSENPIRRWKIVIVNHGSKHQQISLPNAKYLGDLDGQEVHFKTDYRPASRFLYYHFVVTLLRSRSYRQPGWEQVWTELKTGHPWPTPGPYLRRSMLLTLARLIGDVTDEEYVESLINENTFNTPDCLAVDEEEEIARRVQEICEGNVDKGEEDEGEEEEDEEDEV
ncbi:MAG: hypothetical protein M1813_001831 [Trichoglossum hirsutum]|nr:MAG: hypothetical protein M1813_001831 [Trichoglossum hirsutum]